jgi:hypothetical protein
VRLADPIERKLVGTWSEIDKTPLGNQAVMTLKEKTTYRADGTFVTKADVTITPYLFGAEEYSVFDLAGTWLIQDGLLITKYTKFDTASELKLYGSMVKKALPSAGTSVTEKIVSISDTHLITADPKTGKQSVAERVR